MTSKNKKLVSVLAAANQQTAHRLIGHFRDAMSLGYSEENWTKASDLLWHFSAISDLETYHKLSSLMAESYVEPQISHINEVCDEVEASFEV